MVEQLAERLESAGSCKTVAFISCSKTKSRFPCSAYLMYKGPLFVKTLKLCKKHFEDIFILSAEYGLLNLKDKIKPYENTLNDKNKKQIREWSDRVQAQIDELNLKGEFWFFTGEKYSRHFEGQKPFKNISLGNRLKILNHLNKE